MNEKRSSTPFLPDLIDAQKNHLYVSVMMKGSYKYASGTIEKVGDVLTRLRNDKGLIMILNEDIRMMMTYEGEKE